jgi:shikimate dehydrogenase
MRKACVIGWPVAHSLSPKLHGFWLKQYGIDGSYEPWEIKPDQLPQAMQDLRAQKFIGCNLTLPHKELVMPLLATFDDAAKAIGAANTITVRPDGTLHGANTDAYGFSENIRSQGGFAGKHKAVVLGAGGAARAVVKALRDEGFKQIILCNRTVEKAQSVAGHFGVAAAAWEQRAQLLEGTDLLVNATSLGLKDNPKLDLDLALLPRAALVCDIVYHPLMTDFLKAAQARGNPTIDGLGMLIWQAVPAFEAWFGVRPEVTKEVRNYLMASL